MQPNWPLLSNHMAILQRQLQKIIYLTEEAEAKMWTQFVPNVTVFVLFILAVQRGALKPEMNLWTRIILLMYK